MRGLTDFMHFFGLGATCEEVGMADIPYGEATREEGGAVYR